MPFLLIAAIAVLGLGVWLIMRDPASIAERELAMGTNVSPPGQRFAAGARYKIPGDSPDPLPWCGMFARFCADEAHKPLPGNQFLIPSVSALESAFAATGGLLGPTEEPKRGDVVLLRGIGPGDPDELGFGDRHVGVVVFVDDTFVYSIDGDYGTPDGVRRVRRDRDQHNISGYGRW